MTGLYNCELEAYAQCHTQQHIFDADGYAHEPVNLL
jgi:hypothetical protein